jgi:hypothetical protein
MNFVIKVAMDIVGSAAWKKAIDVCAIVRMKTFTL